MKYSVSPRFAKSRLVCFGGLLAALAFVLQSAPVWSAFGLALSPLSTAPAAAAAILSPLCGISVFLSASVMLLIVSAQEALIFMLGTGLLGVVLGLTMRRDAAFGISAAGLSLLIGLYVLFYVCGVSLFGPFTQYIQGFAEIFLIAFSVLYAALWRVLLRCVFKRLKGVKT
jgi:hypothetical protein